MLVKHASHEQAFRIIQALIGQGLDAAQPSTAADELRAGDVFACLRDMLSASSTSSLDGAKATDFQLGVRLLKTLCDIFRPYLTGSKSIYAFCAEKRHRCYQWTAMCRLGTWILLRTQTEPAPIECSRLCWLQIHRMDPAADLQVWGLLLNESLGHIASSKGVLLANLDAQSRMFSALAPLFTRIIQSVPALSANKLARALVLKALGACDTLLRLIPPHAASMGLFNPGSRAPVEEGTFAQLKCTAGDYVFRPPPAPDSGSSSPSSTNGYDSNSDDSNDPIAEQRHEESDEFDREGRLCEMLAAFVTLANYITLGADGDGMRSVLAMAVRSSLQWISTLAMSARDNANKQVRLLETRRRVNIGVVGEHTRLIAFATDWSRLQRIPVIRHRESSDDTPAKRTYKDTAAQVVRLLASVPVWSILGDDCQPILERCLGRASDDDPASRPFEGVRFCHNLSALLSPGDLLQAAFLALRTLSSILGVHSQLASGNITRLRLPQLQVRGYSPKSDEAFMQLAVQTGLCELLLVPSFVDRCTAFVAHCEEDTNGYSLVLRAGQIWLDMIGSIARHSLFRTHIGIACGTSPSAAGDGRLQFHVWWIRALAMGTDCLVGALASPGDMDRIRLACILPAHLLSWHKYLPATPGFVERFAGLKAPLVTEDAQQPRQSAISVIYFLACRLWYQLRLLDPELGDDPATLRVGRDVWGISSDALGMLQGLVRFLAARRLLRDLGLLEDLGCLVSDLMADQNTPQLIARLIHLPESPAATPTICHDDDPLVHPLLQIYEFSDDDDDDTSGGSAASEDVVGKLLRDFDQNQTPSTTQRPLQEYYRPRVLSRLWSEFTTNLVVLPAAISLGSLASGPRLSERKADVIEWLSDADDIFFCAFTPLLAVREHLAEQSPLWRAVGKGLQFADVSSSLELVPISDHTFPRLCVSAALVVPELQQVRLPDSPCAMVCTVAGQLAAHLSHDRRCRTALLFLAWRQRKSLGGHLRQGTDHLRQAAMHILGEMPSSASLLSEQPIVVRGILDDSEPSGPIATSMAFLVEHSPVFGAMFTGPFSEARLARDGQQVFELLADHTALHTLLRILHNCAQQQQPIVGLEDDDDEGLLARLLDGRLGFF
ncbi:hypothetical protein GGF46_001727 [Coemansia sp. RSA 552]|nr:hypothetical protein GGF46_001727 [Coemansia sp. RSA 552]